MAITYNNSYKPKQETEFEAVKEKRSTVEKAHHIFRIIYNSSGVRDFSILEVFNNEPVLAEQHWEQIYKNGVYCNKLLFQGYTHVSVFWAEHDTKTNELKIIESVFRSKEEEKIKIVKKVKDDSVLSDIIQAATTAGSMANGPETSTAGVGAAAGPTFWEPLYSNNDHLSEF